jgi:hypothetical protein
LISVLFADSPKENSRKADDQRSKPTVESSVDFVIENSGYDPAEDLEHSGSGAGTNGRARQAPADEETVGIAVIDVTQRRDVFNYLTLCADMVQDHLPDNYTKAVAVILRQARSGM